MADRLVIAGAGLGGLRTIEGLRRRGFKHRITIGGESELPYDRPPLSKEVLSGEAAPESVIFRARAVYEELGVDLVLGTPAVALDLDGSRLLCADEWMPFDQLVIATGAKPRSLPLLADATNAFVLRTLDDARALRAALVEARRVAIIGAGFIGGEVASSARRLGLDVTVIEALQTPLETVIGRLLGDACAGLHRRNGVDLRCGVSLVGATIDENRRVRSLALSDGSTVAADVVVVAIGVEPSIDWLHGSGLELGRGVHCDNELSAQSGKVWCVGDVAARWDADRGAHVRVEHWTSAVEHARSVSKRIAGWRSVDPNPTSWPAPYFWSDQHGVRIQLVGAGGPAAVEMVAGSPENDHLVALYRDDAGRLTGALTWNLPALCMQLKAMIESSRSWNDALAAVRSSLNLDHAEEHA